MLGVVEQILTPPLPPFAHMQLLHAAATIQTIVGSEQPLKHKASELPQAKPVHP
jgi:hypothetical protein